MKAKNLAAAMDAASRFLRIAKIAMPSIQTSEYIEYGANAAAAKRASMDLTRALAVIRRSDND